MIRVHEMKHMFIKKGSECISIFVQLGYSVLNCTNEEIDSLRTREVTKNDQRTTILGFLSQTKEFSSYLETKYVILSTEEVGDSIYHIVGSYCHSNEQKASDIGNSVHNSLFRLNTQAKDILSRHQNHPNGVDSYEMARVIKSYVSRYGNYTEIANDKKFLDEYNFLLSLVSYSLVATASMHNLNALNSKIHRMISNLPDSLCKNDLKRDISSVFKMLEFSWSLKPEEFNHFPSNGDEVAKAILNFANNVSHKSINVSQNIETETQINPARTSYNNLIYCFQLIFDNAVYWANNNIDINLIELEGDRSNYNKALIISNDGEQIQESKVAELFTKTKSQRAFGGNGVGLYIAKLLARQGGFEVYYDYDKEYSQNTTFVLKWRSRH